MLKDKLLLLKYYVLHFTWCTTDSDVKFAFILQRPN
jgi:hypothetical protein